jgi:Tfp pilus assembly protein PilF
MPKPNATALLYSIGTGFVFVTLALAALLILPLSEQPLLHSKTLVLFVATIFFLVLFMIKSWQQRFITLLVSPLTWPVVLFGAATLASTFFTSNYPVEHLLGMGGVFLCLVALTLFAPNVISKEQAESWLMPSIVGVGILVTVTTLLQLFGFGPSHLVNLFFPIDFPSTTVFNLTGSTLIAAQLLFILVVGVISSFLGVKKSSLVTQLGVVALLAGLGLYIWTLLPNQPTKPILLPHTATWSVAADILKAPKTALIGLGPQGFQNAFAFFKPNWINQTELWNIQFSQGSNTPLSLLITLGLFGLISWLFLVYVLIRQTNQVTATGKPVHFMLLASLLIQLFVPLTVVIATTQALLMVLWVVFESSRFAELEIYGLTFRKVKNKTVAHPLTNHTQMILYLFLTVMAVVVLGSSYGVGRSFLAYFYSLQALVAAQNNDAVGVYNHQRQAVILNPYLDELRRRYASTNLTIASALAQKQDATEEEKQQLNQLVQQSIREGQAATLIDPLDSNNWLSLAQTYRSLIGVAEAADQWTVSTYLNAAQTDPQNPVILVELGGILYGAENYNQAAQLFQQAAESKPDYPNAYYNLANALVKLNQYEQAKAVYQQTLQLIPADTEDYSKASQELEMVDKKLAEIAKAKPATSETNPLTNQTTLTASGSAQTLLTTPPTGITESPLDTVSQPSGEDLQLN